MCAPAWARWQAEKERLMDEMHGDQNVITALMWPDRIALLPNESIQSYKYGVQLGKQLPAPMVVFHGDPKPHQVREQWLIEHWR